MNLSLDFRRALFGIGGGLFVFWILQKSLLNKEGNSNSDTENETIPNPSDEDIQKALIAYQAAVQAGENQQALLDLNTDLSKEFGVRVYRRKTDGRFVATDLAGKELETM